MQQAIPDALKRNVGQGSHLFTEQLAYLAPFADGDLHPEDAPGFFVVAFLELVIERSCDNPRSESNARVFVSNALSVW
jgi:hypothetical protein